MTKDFENLNEFSFTEIVQEFKTKLPDLYEFVFKFMLKKSQIDDGAFF